MSSRRNFIKNSVWLLAFSQFLISCADSAKKIVLRWVLPNKHLGHRLLTMDFPKPNQSDKTTIAIIGGGISGLVTGYYLLKNGITDFIIIELEKEAGGNSRYLQHPISPSPLGAHYLPLPNKHDAKLIDLLIELDVLYKDADGSIEANEDYLCHDLQERLFLFNKWQEDQLPKTYQSSTDQQEFSKFYTYIKALQNEKDAIGRYYFDIPISSSSTETKYHHLDTMTMQDWLIANGYQSKMIWEHIDYCCRDDFGLGISEVSAWAGLHYFAGRKTDAWSHYHDTVLTSAKGNGFLVDKLTKILNDKIRSQQLAYQVSKKNGMLISNIYDETKKISYELECEKIVLATPQYVSRRLMPERIWKSDFFYYNPWVVANILLIPNEKFNKKLLAWDNVLFYGKGLGYIYNQHQDSSFPSEKISITYYYTVRDVAMHKRRKFVHDKSTEYWKEFIINDLELAHPDIRSQIESMSINIWGHGMVSPRPHFILNQELKKYGEPIENKIFFAHSDLAGISIFEEAFHQGWRAAHDILNTL